MKHKPLFFLFPFIFFAQAVAAQTQPANYVSFSASLLTAVKKQQPADELFAQLAALPKDSLAASLNTDDKRKAFWLNVYNAAIQFTLQKKPELLDQKAAYPEQDMVTVAGRRLSPDFIVHRILRRSKNKYGLGYVNKLFVTEYEKLMRVEFVDYRIHFATNNGSASCGPVDVYQEATADDQLSWSTIFFLQKEAQYDSTRKTVSLPKMLEWYKADFGGDKGLLQLLQKLLIIPAAGEKTKLLFREYDWTPKLRNYR